MHFCIYIQAVITEVYINKATAINLELHSNSIALQQLFKMLLNTSTLWRPSVWSDIATKKRKLTTQFFQGTKIVNNILSLTDKYLRQNKIFLFVEISRCGSSVWRKSVEQTTF